MNILDKIIAHKKEELKLKKELVPIDVLQSFPHYQEKRLSLKASLLEKNSTGIIAEFKRRSPSKGTINKSADLEDIISAYDMSAAGISVLTDQEFFAGSNDDLVRATEIASIPILRKDFMVDEYQVYESRAIGADVILLIASCLVPDRTKELALLAKQLGLEVLLEIHDEKELDHICEEVDVVGVNNRNLKTFEVDISTSLKLFKYMPKDKPAITESGISDVNTIITLRNAGFKGFLIGEHFMKRADPAVAFREFVLALKKRLDNPEMS